MGIASALLRGTKAVARGSKAKKAKPNRGESVSQARTVKNPKRTEIESAVRERAITAKMNTKAKAASRPSSGIPRGMLSFPAGKNPAGSTGQAGRKRTAKKASTAKSVRSSSLSPGQRKNVPAGTSAVSAIGRQFSNPKNSSDRLKGASRKSKVGSLLSPKKRK
jgi:hypothetical protein